MELVLDKFIDAIVDKYGNTKTPFNYTNLIELAFKFSKNDNRLNKRGRPKKEKDNKKNYWDVVMHYYSLEPTKYLKIKVDDSIKIHTGKIGYKDDCQEYEYSNDEECSEMIKKYILSFKKKNFEIMYKNETIII